MALNGFNTLLVLLLHTKTRGPIAF